MKGRRIAEKDLALIEAHRRKYRKLNKAIRLVLHKAAKHIRKETAMNGKRK